MFRKIFILLVTSLLIANYGFLTKHTFAQEEKLTITTYYPSPYGSYRELAAYRMKIGDNYSGSSYCWPPDTCTNQIDTNADLVVEGNVGIGIINPGTKLHILGQNPGLRFDDVSNLANPDGSRFMDWDIVATHSGNTGRLDIRRGGGGVNVMSILETTTGGNVGIGTTSPQITLDIVDNIGGIGGFLGAAGIGISSNLSGHAPAIFLSHTGTGGRQYRISSFGDNINPGRFSIRDEAAQTERLVIDNAGNVGIGTSTLPPTSRLSIGSNGYDGREYLKIDMESGTPPTSECNEQPEGGRMIYDDGNHVLWVCDGAGGWKRVGSTLTFITRESPWVSGGSGLLTLNCAAGETMVSGGCYATDQCTGNDWSGYGGFPNGNGWSCQRWSCNNTRAYVRCLQP